MSLPADLDSLVTAIQSTAVREHMTVAEAIQYQFELVEAIQHAMGSDEIFIEDYGQVRALATVGFGGGGRPRSTARVEEVLGKFFSAEDAVLVHGAGTAAIRALLNASLRPAARVALHKAHPYKTTIPAMEHMGLDLEYIDFNDVHSLRHQLRDALPDAVYVQYVPQQIGDVHDIDEIITVVREELGDRTLILTDDNYAVMRSKRIGCQLGADASAFSLFKLLARFNIGCVVGRRDIISSIRRDLSSAGCQVQGPDAMDALRSLVYAPVALAIQNEVVETTAPKINDLISDGQLPYVHAAVAAQPGMRCIVLVFDVPVAEDFLRSAWRNGAPSQSVGEESRFEVVPLFTYLSGTVLKSIPGLEKFAVRINPLRGGPDTIVRILRDALSDRDFLRSAAEIERTAGRLESRSANRGKIGLF